MKASILGLCLSLSLILKTVAVFAQANQGDFINMLKHYNQNHISEKAYLHFDKPYYAAGDTMYFKAYITMGERHYLSKISGLLHAELLNTKDKILQGIKLQIVNGIAWGDFALPDSLPAGNYRIRAYTQWMLNSDNESFFDKVISIGALRNHKASESSIAHMKPVSAKPDMQFFPEGGELIAGIMSKVAFKAVGVNGLGMDVSGDIMDNTGRKITSFKSLHLGMGYFWLNPEPGRTYNASLSFANGTTEVIALPKAGATGITIAINNDSLALASVKIEANPAYYQENKNKEYTLLIYSGGYATTVNCRLDSQSIKLDIIKRRIFTGVTRITLFSGTEPLCERLLFVQNFDQLNLQVSSDKSNYAARSKVRISINARTRADSASSGHFSVSVIDENKVPVNVNDEPTILTNLLLTSDLKGYVEQPGYYFADSVLNRLKKLDLVMLTHGYRRFEWKHVFNTDDKSTAIYSPERSISISGTAESLLGGKLPKAKVSLLSVQSRQFITDTADDKGHFKFDGMYFTDTAKYILQAVSAKGGKRTNLTYSPWKPITISPLPPGSQNISEDTMMHAYLDNNQKIQDQQAKLDLSKIRVLQEVKINDYHSSNILGPGHADQVLHEKDFQNIGGPLSTKLNGLLRGINIINGVPISRGLKMNIYLDYTPISNLDQINPNDIETVEVLKFATASIYGVNGGAGVVILTSKQGKARSLNDIASVGVLPIAVQGFYKARVFYEQKYDATAMKSDRPDLRSTIYWAPELATDKNGDASFEFYNADGRGNYRVLIEGIDDKGNIGRQVYRYKVQ